MNTNRTQSGITTVGAVATLLIAGVIFGDLNPWWLALAIPMTLSAVGLESGR